MKITYIGHAGFLVETEQVTLLFDYYQGEIPPMRRDVPLVIFSSHRHGDHFNPEILNLPGRPSDTTWVLSEDIRQEEVVGTWAMEDATGERIIFVEDGESRELHELRLWTLKSTDEGVAFLIRLQDALIYHCGDLNWWLWDEDTEQEAQAMTDAFFREVAILSNLVRENGGILDAAFLTLDPRQEKFEFYGMDHYREKIPMKNIFPMHCFDQYEINERYLKAHPELTELNAASDPGDTQRMAVIRRRGELFEIFP